MLGNGVSWDFQSLETGWLIDSSTTFRGRSPDPFPVSEAGRTDATTPIDRFQIASSVAAVLSRPGRNGSASRDSFRFREMGLT